MIKKYPDTKLNIDTKAIIADSVTLGPNCKTITIGIGSYIGDNVYIDVPEFTVGEYTTIHKNTTIHGYKNCSIGHNCWIGQNTIIDSIGGTKIGNNVGIGSYSQLWSHIKFGDNLAGCKWNSKKELIIEDDVWFVGHCIVSPIVAKKGAMAMIGSIITKDMKENHIYAGSPAKDMSDKFGFQFEEKTYASKQTEFLELYDEFLRINNLSNEEFPIEIDDIYNPKKEYKNAVSTFFLMSRSYISTRSDLEISFIKSMLYEKAKFIPVK